MAMFYYLIGEVRFYDSEDLRTLVEKISALISKAEDIDETDDDDKERVKVSYLNRYVDVHFDVATCTNSAVFLDSEKLLYELGNHVVRPTWIRFGKSLNDEFVLCRSEDKNNEVQRRKFQIMLRSIPTLSQTELSVLQEVVSAYVNFKQ